MKPEDANKPTGKTAAMEAMFPGVQKYVPDNKMSSLPADNSSDSTFIMFTDDENGLVADQAGHAKGPVVFHGTKNEDVDFNASKYRGSEGRYLRQPENNEEPGQGRPFEPQRLILKDDISRKNFRDFLAESAGYTATHEPLHLTIGLEEWIGFKENSAEGLDPVLRDFLRVNPHYFDPTTAEREGITLRELGGVSDFLRRCNPDKPTVQNGSDWVLNKLILDAYLSPKVANELIGFAKDQGINVITPKGKKVALDTDSSLKM
jgi:hypothetical protein